MTIRIHRWRTAAAVAATALSVALISAIAGSAPASADPVRTAATSSDTTYLSDTLGLSASTVVETVTYDRFQWLLQQPGKFAFLVGDPAEDANFKAEAQSVDTAAQAAHVSKVYWFDPNLTGSARRVGQLDAAEPRHPQPERDHDARRGLADDLWQGVAEPDRSVPWQRSPRRVCRRWEHGERDGRGDDRHEHGERRQRAPVRLHLREPRPTRPTAHLLRVRQVEHVRFDRPRQPDKLVQRQVRPGHRRELCG